MRVELNEDYYRVSEDYLETLRTLVIKAKASEFERNRARSVEVSHQAFLFNISSADTLRHVEFAPKAMQLGVWKS